MTTIRDLREQKNLSQTAVAEACGLTFSRYERIEVGSPRTTEEEIKSVLKVLRGMKKSDKKLVGRPFADPAKQAAVEAARAAGQSVSAVLTGEVAPAPEPKPKRTRKPKSDSSTSAISDLLI
jgi:transcriptional regulator with XRE-family HTH domain